MLYNKIILPLSLPIDRTAPGVPSISRIRIWSSYSGDGVIQLSKFYAYDSTGRNILLNTAVTNITVQSARPGATTYPPANRSLLVDGTVVAAAYPTAYESAALLRFPSTATADTAIGYPVEFTISPASEVSNIIYVNADNAARSIQGTRIQLLSGAAAPFTEVITKTLQTNATVQSLQFSPTETATNTMALITSSYLTSLGINMSASALSSPVTGVRRIRLLPNIEGGGIQVSNILAFNSTGTNVLFNRTPTQSSGLNTKTGTTVAGITNASLVPGTGYESAIEYASYTSLTDTVNLDFDLGTTAQDIAYIVFVNVAVPATGTRRNTQGMRIQLLSTNAAGTHTEIITKLVPNNNTIQAIQFVSADVTTANLSSTMLYNKVYGILDLPGINRTAAGVTGVTRIRIFPSYSGDGVVQLSKFHAFDSKGNNILLNLAAANITTQAARPGTTAYLATNRTLLVDGTLTAEEFPRAYESAPLLRLASTGDTTTGHAVEFTIPTASEISYIIYVNVANPATGTRRDVVGTRIQLLSGTTTLTEVITKTLQTNQTIQGLQFLPAETATNTMRLITNSFLQTRFGIDTSAPPVTGVRRIRLLPNIDGGGVQLSSLLAFKTDGTNVLLNRSPAQIIQNNLTAKSGTSAITTTYGTLIAETGYESATEYASYTSLIDNNYLDFDLGTTAQDIAYIVYVNVANPATGTRRNAQGMRVQLLSTTGTTTLVHTEIITKLLPNNNTIQAIQFSSADIVPANLSSSMLTNKVIGGLNLGIQTGQPGVPNVARIRIWPSFEAGDGIVQVSKFLAFNSKVQNILSNLVATSITTNPTTFANKLTLVDSTITASTTPTAFVSNASLGIVSTTATSGTIPIDFLTNSSIDSTREVSFILFVNPTGTGTLATRSKGMIIQLVDANSNEIVSKVLPSDASIQGIQFTPADVTDTKNRMLGIFQDYLRTTHSIDPTATGVSNVLKIRLLPSYDYTDGALQVSKLYAFTRTGARVTLTAPTVDTATTSLRKDSNYTSNTKLIDGSLLGDTYGTGGAYESKGTTLTIPSKETNRFDFTIASASEVAYIIYVNIGTRTGAAAERVQGMRVQLLGASDAEIVTKKLPNNNNIQVIQFRAGDEAIPENKSMYFFMQKFIPGFTTGCTAANSAENVRYIRITNPSNDTLIVPGLFAYNNTNTSLLENITLTKSNMNDIAGRWNSSNVPYRYPNFANVVKGDFAAKSATATDMIVIDRNRSDNYVEIDLQSERIISYLFFMLLNQRVPDASFNPRHIPRLQLWLDGNDPLNTGAINTRTGLITFSSTTHWIEKSGSGITTSTNLQRTGSIVMGKFLNSTSTDGRRVVRIDSDGGIQVNYGSVNANSKLTIFAVFVTRGTSLTAAATVNQYVLTTRSPITNRLVLGVENNATAANVTSYTGTGNSWTGGTPAANTPEVPTYNKFVNVCMILDGSTIRPYTNGIGQNPKSGQFDGFTDFFLGNNAETAMGGNDFDGEIAEILVYDEVLTDNQRELVEAYLARKWSLTDSLSFRNSIAGDDTNNNDFLTQYANDPLKQSNINGVKIDLLSSSRQVIASRIISGIQDNVKRDFMGFSFCGTSAQAGGGAYIPITQAGGGPIAMRRAGPPLLQNGGGSRTSMRKFIQRGGGTLDIPNISSSILTDIFRFEEGRLAVNNLNDEATQAQLLERIMSYVSSISADTATAEEKYLGFQAQAQPILDTYAAYKGEREGYEVDLSGAKPPFEEAYGLTPEEQEVSRTTLAAEAEAAQTLLDTTNTRLAELPGEIEEAGSTLQAATQDKEEKEGVWTGLKDEMMEKFGEGPNANTPLASANAAYELAMYALLDAEEEKRVLEGELEKKNSDYAANKALLDPVLAELTSRFNDDYDSVRQVTVGAKDAEEGATQFLNELHTELDVYNAAASIALQQVDMKQEAVDAQTGDMEIKYGTDHEAVAAAVDTAQGAYDAAVLAEGDAQTAYDEVAAELATAEEELKDANDILEEKNAAFKDKYGTDLAEYQKAKDDALTLIAKLELEEGATEEEIGGLEAAIEEMKTALQELETAVNDLREEIMSNYNSNIGGIQQSIENLNEEIHDVVQESADAEKEKTDAEAAYEAAKQARTKADEALAEAIATLKEKFGNNTSAGDVAALAFLRMEEARAAMQAAEREMKTHAAYMKRVESQKKVLEFAVEELQKKKAEAEEDLREKREALDAAAIALEKNVEQLKLAEEEKRLAAEAAALEEERLAAEAEAAALEREATAAAAAAAERLAAEEAAAAATAKAEEEAAALEERLAAEEAAAAEVEAAEAAATAEKARVADELRAAQEARIAELEEKAEEGRLEEEERRGKQIEEEERLRQAAVELRMGEEDRLRKIQEAEEEYKMTEMTESERRAYMVAEAERKIQDEKMAAEDARLAQEQANQKAAAEAEEKRIAELKKEEEERRVKFEKDVYGETQRSMEKDFAELIKQEEARRAAEEERARVSADLLQAKRDANAEKVRELLLQKLQMIKEQVVVTNQEIMKEMKRISFFISGLMSVADAKVKEKEEDLLPAIRAAELRRKLAAAPALQEYFAQKLLQEEKQKAAALGETLTEEEEMEKFATLKSILSRNISVLGAIDWDTLYPDEPEIDTSNPYLAALL